MTGPEPDPPKPFKVVASEREISIALAQVEAVAEANNVPAAKRAAMLQQARDRLEGKGPP